MIIFAYLATIFMGMTLGVLGGGGSILTVPILVYLFKVDPILATSYSLFIVGLSALFGGINYLRQGQVDFKVGFLFAIPSFVGVYLTRAFVLPWLPDVIYSFDEIVISKSLLVMMTFSLLMIIASFSMIRTQKKVQTHSNIPGYLKTLIIILEGLVVGAITGFVGAGGGFLIIPALVLLIGLPMKVAVGTSLFIISSKSFIGLMGDFQAQVAIDWTFLLIISSLGVVGILLGNRLSSKVSDNVLKKIFGYFVLVMGSIITFENILSLF